MDRGVQHIAHSGGWAVDQGVATRLAFAKAVATIQDNKRAAIFIAMDWSRIDNSIDFS